MQEKFYTLNEIMELLRITKITVYRYIKSGKLKAYKIGKEFRISQKDFDEFLLRTRFTPIK